MYKNFKFSLILLLSGEGARFGSDKPKQFHNLSGKKIYLHALDTFYNLKIFDEIILVCLKDWIEIVKNEVSNYENIKIIAGGAKRQQSSYLGLLNCSNPDYVLFHDAVRPFVSKRIILENLDKVIKYKAVDTCIKSTDTLVEIDKENNIERIPNRASLLRGQTPQTFEYSLILNAHKNAFTDNNLSATDDCQLVIDKTKIHVVLGDENNLKITTKLDLFIAEQIFRMQNIDLTSSSKEDLSNKVFAVVGATGGIGKQIVNYLKKEKAIVLELSRSSEHKIDLKNFKSIKLAFQKIFEKYGEISGLINAAGLFLVKPLKDTTKKEIDDLIRINLTGLIYCCKEAKISNNGHIINISSSSYFMGRKNYGVYSATKAAIVNFTQSLAEEYPNIKINTIVPQRTNTLMRKKYFPDEDENLLLDPKEIASGVIEILKNNITGSIIEIKK
jgi:ribitol-5-phosphate 2-dehydrogenase (NADP+) / D-ribitol-5-phosphate cytidylyltransferase